MIARRWAGAGVERGAVNRKRRRGREKGRAPWPAHRRMQARAQQAKVWATPVRLACVCVCGGRGDGVVTVVWQESRKFSCARQQSSLVEEREVSSRLPASSFTPGATQAAAAPRPGHRTCCRGRWRHCWNGWRMKPKTKPAMQATRQEAKHNCSPSPAESFMLQPPAPSPSSLSNSSGRPPLCTFLFPSKDLVGSKANKLAERNLGGNARWRARGYEHEGHDGAYRRLFFCFLFSYPWIAVVNYSLLMKRERGL